MKNYESLVLTDQIDSLRALSHLSDDEILDLYSCSACGSVNWERYSYAANGNLYLDELRCATCKTPAPDDDYLYYGDE